MKNSSQQKARLSSVLSKKLLQTLREFIRETQQVARRFSFVRILPRKARDRAKGKM